MSDLSSALWGALNGPSPPPVVLVLYDSLEDRDRLSESIALQLDETRLLLRSDNIQDAFLRLQEVVLVSLSSDQQEIDALDELAGRRESLLQRTEPVVLFLSRGNSVQAHLSDPSLAGLLGWVRGSVIDPVELNMIDSVSERAVFEAKNGATVEVWLAQWRAGELPATLDNQLWFHRALLLAMTP